VLMADDFGTAIYTNCAPGQGLGGVGGMQFQSCSAGVDDQAMALIRRHLVYEPPERLIMDRQPIEAFPPSFAHVHDGLFATAAGVYIGREASGVRQGNHLTHAIVTSDANSYHSVRPAQMFRAPFWRKEPAPTTQSERQAMSWQPGSLDAADACRFVNSQPAGRALLTALLTALLALSKGTDPGDARRVLFISETVDPVLYWLTAATLLIPYHDAVRIGFKVFTTDPARSALPVLAVHPDWTKSTATVEDDRGYAVFDLVQHRWSQVPENPGARHWANLFCRADPYEVSDAVELAAASGLSENSARDLATAVLLGRVPEHADADVLVRWLRTGPAAAREAYGGKLVDALIPLQDPNLLLSLDLIAASQFPGRSDSIRLALLRLELDDALLRQEPSWAARRGWSSVFVSDRALRKVSAQARAEATELVTDYLRRASDDAFDAVLQVSAKFGISVPFGQLRQATATFVASWADSSTATYDPSRWPADSPVYRMLIDELSERVVSKPAAAASIADQWWNRLGNWKPDRADIASPLDRALLSATMANSTERDRLRIVRSILNHHRDRARTYSELATVLWGRTRATTQEARLLCDTVPAGTKLDPEIFADVLAGASGSSAGLVELELCADLNAKRLLTLNAQTAELLDYHRVLAHHETRMAAGAWPPDLMDSLRLVPPPLVTAHAGLLARGLSAAIEDPGHLVSLIPALPWPVASAYLWDLSDGAGQRATPARMAVAFTVCGFREIWWREFDPFGDLRTALAAGIEEWRKNMSKKEANEVAKQLAPLGRHLVKAWEGHSRGWWRRNIWVARINSSQSSRQTDQLWNS
jgi:hypothetical protein